MEEAQEILFNSLKNSGISLPEGVSSIRELTPGALVSICSRSLKLIDDSLSFPISLPDSMADRYKVCAEISSAIKNLGYRGDMSFHQFLYPSEEGSYKLMRFLVERLSETPESGNILDKTEMKARFKTKEDKLKGSLNNWAEKFDGPGVDQNYQTVSAKLKKLTLKIEAPETDVVVEDAFVKGSLEGQETDDHAVVVISRSGSLESSEEEELSAKDVKDAVEESEKSRRDGSGNEESASQRKDGHAIAFDQKLASLPEKSSKIRNEIEDLRNQEKMLMQELTTKALEYQHLEDDHELLKEAVKMALDDHHPVDLHIEELNRRVEARRQNLVELESQWNASIKSLEEKKRSLEELLEVQENLPRVKEIELETEAIISEIRSREEEHSKLSLEFEKQPRTASRKSYIQRITEITKNSRKQDADIERILKETRELQIESNSIQERLQRTYAVADETMFRDAKKDPVRRQAYELLTSIHESFEQISEKILATDRTRREVAEQEAKLATMATRGLNLDKLQADLDAIRKENEYLEQQLHHN